MKEPWRTRKVRYLLHLEQDDENVDALVVSAADKLHNCRAILSDYRHLGEDLWRKFNSDAGRPGNAWYYRRLAEIFGRRLPGPGSGRPL